MRPYRGLTKEGEWIYGWYIEMPAQKLDVKDLGHGAISCEKKNAVQTISCIAYLPNHGAGLAFSRVIPETVGQSIGLKDNKRTEEYPEGQEIYQGDTVKLGNHKILGEVKIGRHTLHESGPCRDIECYGVYFDFYKAQLGIIEAGRHDAVEVISNIHQNPELLKD